MKNNFYKFILLISVGVFILSGMGCRKLEDFGNTNVNPNGSPDVLTSALLTNIEIGLGGITGSLIPGHFAQYYAEPAYPGNSLYILPEFNSAAIYSGILIDAQVIINKNTDPATAPGVAVNGDNQSQIAIARILKAYIFWTVTDRWGDIPYSEALKGAEILTPKYDEQEFIYKDLIKELTEAKDQFNLTGTAIKGDIIYNGDGAKWKKLANSLRMLMSMRLSKKYPAPGDYAATQFNMAFTDPDGYIATNADNFTIPYPGGAFRNPFYSVSLSLDNRMAKTYTDLLVGLNDDRITAHSEGTNGVPYGLASAAPGTGYSKILSSAWYAEDAPLVIINAASVLLAIAEAAERGWVVADAKTFYDDGVTKSFEQWDLALPADYLTSGPANFVSGGGVSTIGGSTVTGSNASTSSRLTRIQLQQYIAFFPDGLQAWSNWRRTGVPDLEPTIFATNSSKQITRRYTYGTIEENRNPDQLKIAVARIPGGLDSQDARVWWDQ